MNMKDALKESCVIADLKGRTKEEVLTELGRRPSRQGGGFRRGGDGRGNSRKGKAGQYGHRRGNSHTAREDEGHRPVYFVPSADPRRASISMRWTRSLFISCFCFWPRRLRRPSHSDVIPDIKDLRDPTFRKAPDRAGRRPESLCGHRERR